MSKTKGKKILSLVLTLCMVLSLLPTMAFAAERQEYSPTLVEVKVGGTDVTPKASGTSQPTNFTNGVWLPTAISSFEESGIEVTANDSATLTYAVNDQYSMTAEQITATVLATELEKLSDTNNKLWIKAVKDETTEIVGMSFAVMASNADSLAKILGETNAEENTVKLSKNVTVDKVIKVKLGEDAVTLDLNGHSITGEIQGDKNTTGSIFSLEAGKLTITDNSQGTAKGSIKNTAAKDSADDSSAVQISNATLTVKGVTLSGGNNVVKISGKTAELDITGAIIKADNPEKDDAIAIKASNTPKLIINADPETGATEVHGKMNGMWAEGSKISGGYYTDFTLNAVTGGKSILETGYGLVPVDNDKQSTFAYKVGTVDTNSAEGYVNLDEQGNNKVYGDINMLVKFYGSQKTIYVKKTANLTLDKFGDVVGGKYNGANTLTFEADSELQQDVTLTISGTIKVGLIKHNGEKLKVVTDSINPVDGYKKVEGETGEIKYDVDLDSSTAVAEVTIGQGKYTYTVDSLSAMFRDIQGKDATVKLLKDVSYGQQIKLGGDTKLTLDLNGHTYTYTGETAAFNVTGKEGSSPAELTVKDSSGNKTGVLDCSKTDEAICVGDFTKKEITQAANKVIIDAGVTVKGSITVIDKGALEVSGAIEAKGFAISGNGSRDGTTITIHNGASLKSENTTAIYHPQEGTLTIGDAKPAEGAAAPEITGVAGVVVRDGTVTVNDADITATGTGDIKVGDAETTVPAGGIVLDSVTGYGTGDEKVTVKDATVTVEEGQPTVTYTEAGEAPDYSEEEAAPNTHIEVTAGTYQSGEGKADPNMVPFISDEVKGNSGLASDGEIKTMISITNEAPFLVDFGYLAAAPQKGHDDKWTSPNGITYTVTDWGDGTFYWCFNRNLTETEIAQNDDKGYAVTFTAPNGESVTDYCHAITSPRFASSLLNKDQLGSAPLTTGNWTIKTGTSEVTVPVEDLPKSVADAAPVVAAATIADKDGATDIVTEGYTAEVTGVNKDGNYIITGTATGLKSHKNGAEPPVEGYWFGVEIEAPEGVTTESGTYTVSGDVTGTSDFDTLYNTTNHATKKGAILYFNTKDDGTDKYTVTIKWDGTHENTYVIDLTGVKHYVPKPVTPSTPTGGSTGGGGGVGSSATVNSVKATNGSFAISDKNAKAGDTVKVTPKANEGYVVDQVTVTDKNGNNITVTQNADGTYSFVMPAKSAQPVDVKVTFKLDDGEKDCPSEKFTDVDQDKWYHEGVDYAIKNGLMNGTGADTFAPDATTTRAMVVTILYRLDGEPAVMKDIPFADVPAGQWYSNAINWAAANGIVNGYGDDKFGPDDTITREQMAAILYRYASYKGYSVSDLANLTGYTDAASVSEWASTAMRWAVAEGLIEGTSATALSPSGDSTRAQVATILMRFCEGAVK